LRGSHQRDEGRAHEGERRELEREPLYGPGGGGTPESREKVVLGTLVPSRPATPIFACLVS
jgi:hypothetical protein